LRSTMKNKSATGAIWRRYPVFWPGLFPSVFTLWTTQEEQEYPQLPQVKASGKERKALNSFWRVKNCPKERHSDHPRRASGWLSNGFHQPGGFHRLRWSERSARSPTGGRHSTGGLQAAASPAGAWLGSTQAAAPPAPRLAQQTSAGTQPGQSPCSHPGQPGG